MGFQASAPSMRSAASPSSRGNITLEQPSGVMPRGVNGVEKVAFSEAMMASQSVADVTHAPIAGPLTATRIGFGNRMNVSKSAWLCSTIMACSRAGWPGRIAAPRFTPAQ